MLRENKDKWGKGTKLSRKMFCATWDQAPLLHEQMPRTHVLTASDLGH